MHPGDNYIECSSWGIMAPALPARATSRQIDSPSITVSSFSFPSQLQFVYSTMGRDASARRQTRPATKKLAQPINISRAADTVRGMGHQQI